MQLDLPLSGGHHIGPLFEIRKRRPGKPAMRGGVRYDVVKRRTPAWVDRADFKALHQYRAMLIVFTGEAYELDHIVPLNHPLVCGLHCPANLRVYPAHLNRIKGNNWWPDMPETQLELL